MAEARHARTMKVPIDIRPLMRAALTEMAESPWQHRLTMRLHAGLCASYCAGALHQPSELRCHSIGRSSASSCASSAAARRTSQRAWSLQLNEAMTIACRQPPGDTVRLRLCHVPRRGSQRRRRRRAFSNTPGYHNRRAHPSHSAIASDRDPGSA